MTGTSNSLAALVAALLSGCDKHLVVARRPNHRSLHIISTLIHNNLKRLLAACAWMVSLALGSSTVSILDNVAEIEAVLNWRGSHLAAISASDVLQLLLLYNLFHSLAPEVLEVAQASVVLYIVNDRCKILLSIDTNTLRRRADSLVHDVQMWRGRPIPLNVLKVI